MEIIPIQEWLPRAGKIINDFVKGVSACEKDDFGVYFPVKNKRDHILKYDESTAMNILYYLRGKSGESWYDLLSLELEDTLIKDLYTFNSGEVDYDSQKYFDFEEDFFDNYFKIEKEYVYDLIDDLTEEKLIEMI